VRLKALLPAWMPWIRKRFKLSPEIEKQLLAISPRQMDRRLAAKKTQQRRRIYGRTKPGYLLKHHIPVKTDNWDVTSPGFTEVDLVSHSGNSAEGEFAHSLNITDIQTTWTETRALLGKGQTAVQQALDEIEGMLPFRLLGLDSDNGSEFINWHLQAWCEPPARAVTLASPLTGTGVVRTTVVPSPSWPKVLRPQARAVPSSWAEARLDKSITAIIASPIASLKAGRRFICKRFKQTFSDMRVRLIISGQVNS